MIRTIYKIGNLLSQNPQYADYFYPWKNPFPKNQDAARVIVFDIANGSINPTYQIENFKADFSLYLYREASANGTNLVPTFLYSSDNSIDNIAKRLKKIKQCLTTYKHAFVSTDQIDQLLPILQKIPLNKDNRYLLTFTLNGKYFGEIEEYRNLFLDDAYKKNYEKNYGTALAKNTLCSVTYEVADEVWGFVDTLGFTVNETAFNRNGFDANNAWRMFPVSKNVVPILEGAMSFITEKMTKNFSGLKYFVLPHFIRAENADIEFAVSRFIDINMNPITNTAKNTIIGSEDILEELVEEAELSKNNVYYDLFFYAKNQAQFLIKLHLSDILPSRLRKIYDVKKQLENFYRPITDIQKKDETIQQNIINFATIRNFFAHKAKTDTIFHPAFFKIVEAVFYGNPLNKDLILKAFIQVIQKAYKNRTDDLKKYAYINATKESFILLQFFASLHLFNQQTMENVISATHNSVALTPKDFIAQHPAFFDSEYKKGVFLLGCLTQALLNKQKSKLQNDPFSKNLNSLNLDKTDLEKLLPKLINKLREYDVYYHSDLEAQIAQALVTPCTLTKTDISYTFTLGLIMQREFTNQFLQNKKTDDSTKQS